MSTPAPVKYDRPIQNLVDFIRFHRFEIPERIWEYHSKRNITVLFLREVENRIKSWESVNIVIIGQAGTGKSLSGLLLAKRMAKMAGSVFEIRRNVTGFLPDSVQMISVAEPNTVLIQDEQTRSVGTGSRSMSWTHANLLKTVMRYKQIHFIGIGVELLEGVIPSSVINYILIAKTREIDPTDARKTLSINLELWAKTMGDIRMSDWIPVGRVILHVTAEDEKMIQDYLEFVKAPTVEAFQKEKGMPEISAQTKFREAIDSGIPISAFGQEEFAPVIQSIEETKNEVAAEIDVGRDEIEAALADAEAQENQEPDTKRKKNDKS